MGCTLPIFIDNHIKLKRIIEAKFLWPDALPVANQLESLAGPHLFFNY